MFKLFTLRKPLAILSILLLSLTSFAQTTVTLAGESYTNEDTLPSDPTIRIGELDNGLRYYLRHNAEPANRAELALAIRVGSLMEDDDQQGLAHFLEHMLFNGTESFQGPALVDYLESTGMTFGPDVNASTGHERTFYTLRIPLDDEEMIANALTILAEWANKATLDPEEIDKERGVIQEEERVRLQNVNGRIMDVLVPALYGAESRYTQRLPIGDMDIVRNAPPETFERFYRDWYRPNLMAVMAVGDFDVDAFEQRIRDNFAGLENPDDAPELQAFPVPRHEEGRYFIYRDPEFPYTVSQIIYKLPAARHVTVADFYDSLARDAFSIMMNERLAEISNSEDAPFLQANVGIGRDVAELDLMQFTSVTEADKSEAGLNRLLTEMERVRRFGFTESELERAKLQLLSNFEENYNKREDIDSKRWNEYMLRNFLYNDALTDTETDFMLAQQLLPQLSLEHVNRNATHLNQEANRLTLLVAPDNDALTLPNETDLAAFFVQAQEQELRAYQEESTAETLLADIPEPATILSEAYLEALDVHVLELANGVTVVFKPTDFVAEEVLLSGMSWGGSSRVTDEDFLEADFISDIIGDSGVASFDQTALRRLLTGKQVALSVNINDISEGFSAQSSRDDAETMFQLLYLYATQPRYDEIAFARLQTQIIEFLKNRDNLPDAAFTDAVIAALYGDDMRQNVPSVADVEALDYARAFAIYQERFADMDDFVFTIVGDIALDELKRLAQTYLGNLPQQAGEETWRDVVPALPLGITQREAYKGLEEQSIVDMRFIGEAMDTSFAERQRMKVFENILDILVRKAVREELGAAYSPFVSSSINQIPDATYSITTHIATNPDDVEVVVDTVLAIAEQLRTEEISPESLATAKEQYIRAAEEALEQNSFWLSQLQYYYRHGSDEDVNNIINYQVPVEAISTADMQAMAQRYLDEDRYVQVVLYPEALAPTDKP